jgi:uncharacterized protein (TIGR00297 family)
MLYIVLAVVSLGFALTALWLHYLDIKATLLTIALFLTIVISAPAWWIILVIVGYTAIFVVTAYKRREKEIIRGPKFQNAPKRGYTSIIGKVAVPAIAAVFNLPTLFVAVIIFGVADSFANEIGVLSPRWPRLITNGKRIAPGTNGGVSTLGTIAAVAISLLIGAVAFWLSSPDSSVVKFLFFAGATGVLGCMIDSVLGATLENRKIISGWTVNLISGLIAGLVGSELFLIFSF